MNDVAMFIRMCYPSLVSEEARWRFDYFEHEVLPRILDQTNRRFDLWIWTNPKHSDEVRGMSDKIQTFTVKTGLSPLASRIPWESVVGVPRYRVQLRLDSDDLIARDYVAVALSATISLHERRSIVFFQPWKYELSSGNVYAFRRPYTPERISPFVALQQPLKARSYRWVYGRGHLRLGKYATKTKRIVGHCWMTVHQYNDSTTIRPKDPLLSNSPVYNPAVRP